MSGECENCGNYCLECICKIESNWIKCSDRLPVETAKKVPNYNWCLVTAERMGTGEPWPLSLARYTDFGWEFWDDETKYCCPAFGDTSSAMDVEEITHWMELKKPIN